MKWVLVVLRTPFKRACQILLQSIVMTTFGSYEPLLQQIFSMISRRYIDSRLLRLSKLILVERRHVKLIRCLIENLIIWELSDYSS